MKLDKASCPWIRAGCPCLINGTRDEHDVSVPRIRADSRVVMIPTDLSTQGSIMPMLHN